MKKKTFLFAVVLFTIATASSAQSSFKKGTNEVRAGIGLGSSILNKA